MNSSNLEDTIRAQQMEFIQDLRKREEQEETRIRENHRDFSNQRCFIVGGCLIILLILLSMLFLKIQK